MIHKKMVRVMMAFVVIVDVAVGFVVLGALARSGKRRCYRRCRLWHAVSVVRVF